MACKVYKCLNPVGIQAPVDQFPLAPRLDKLDGKTIYISIGAGGEQDITIPLPKALQRDYPNVNWKITKAAPHMTIAGSIALSEDEMKDADALIRGVVWCHGAIWEQVPTLLTYEKAGIPSVFIIYGDQDGCWQQAAKVNGVPCLRRVHASRTAPGVPDVDRMVPQLIDALTRPLTVEEKKKIRWEVPDKRILFEGTLEEAEKFYEQTEKIHSLDGASIAIYGDGLPIRVPTEERVAEMLKGTSHKPDEIIRFRRTHHLDDRSIQMGNSGKEGDPVHYLPMKRTATVEKIAIIGVMAGCKPEHMPVLLAMAESGGACGDGRGRDGFIISGPYAKEIDMNLSVNILGPGNVSNRSLGRAAHLMWRNLGGNIPSVTNCGIWGSPLHNVIAENVDALPPGWEGLNEESDFNKNESLLVMASTPGGGRVQFSPGGYRAFQKSGHGGIARRLGVKGKPGPHNWLEYIIPGLWDSAEGGITVFMFPEMAQQLYEAGFKSKEEIYQFLFKKSFMTVAEYRTHSWPDMRTNAWLGVERTSGKHWKELPHDYMVPAMNDPWDNCVIVTGFGEEQMMLGAGRTGGSEGAYSIDLWR
jgi:hypothetical protein